MLNTPIPDTCVVPALAGIARTASTEGMKCEWGRTRRRPGRICSSRLEIPSQYGSWCPNSLPIRRGLRLSSRLVAESHVGDFARFELIVFDWRPRLACAVPVRLDDANICCVRAETKSPARGQALCCVEGDAQFALRLVKPKPSKPRPSSASVPGSGTGGGSVAIEAAGHDAGHQRPAPRLARRERVLQRPGAWLGRPAARICTRT